MNSETSAVTFRVLLQEVIDVTRVFTDARVRACVCACVRACVCVLVSCMSVCCGFLFCFYVYLGGEGVVLLLLLFLGGAGGWRVGGGGEGWGGCLLVVF